MSDRHTKRTQTRTALERAENQRRAAEIRESTEPAPIEWKRRDRENDDPCWEAELGGLELFVAFKGEDLWEWSVEADQTLAAGEVDGPDCDLPPQLAQQRCEIVARSLLPPPRYMTGAELLADVRKHADVFADWDPAKAIAELRDDGDVELAPEDERRVRKAISRSAKVALERQHAELLVTIREGTTTVDRVNELHEAYRAVIREHEAACAKLMLEVKQQYRDAENRVIGRAEAYRNEMEKERDGEGYSSMRADIDHRISIIDDVIARLTTDPAFSALDWLMAECTAPLREELTRIYAFATSTGTRGLELEPGQALEAVRKFNAEWEQEAKRREERGEVTGLKHATNDIWPGAPSVGQALELRDRKVAAAFAQARVAARSVVGDAWQVMVEACKVAHSITSEAWQAWARLAFDCWMASDVEMAASAGLVTVDDAKRWRFTVDGEALGAVILETWGVLKEHERAAMMFDQSGRWAPNPEPDEGVRERLALLGLITTTASKPQHLRGCGVDARGCVDGCPFDAAYGEASERMRPEMQWTPFGQIVITWCGKVMQRGHGLRERDGYTRAMEG